MRDKVMGALYGMAIEMPWVCRRNCGAESGVSNYYGVITDFLDGCPENIISYQYKAGAIYR